MMDNELLRETIGLNICGLIGLVVALVCFCIYKIVATIVFFCSCIYEEIATTYEAFKDFCTDSGIGDMAHWIAERRQARELNNLLAEADREIARATQLQTENRVHKPLQRQRRKTQFTPKRKITVVATAKTTIHEGVICFVTGQPTKTCQCPNCK